MSDEPIRAGMVTGHATAHGIEDHICEHEGCNRWGGFGFSKPRAKPKWFCFEHRHEGELYL